MSTSGMKLGINADYCPERLRAFAVGLPKCGRHLLAKNLTEPQGYDRIEKQFRGWRDTLGSRAAPFTQHGLRKLAIVQLAEAGAIDAEIQAVTGPERRNGRLYRAKANRKRLSRQAQERRDRT
jgi:hypothetical protein